MFWVIGVCAKCWVSSFLNISKPRGIGCNIFTVPTALLAGATQPCRILVPGLGISWAIEFSPKLWASERDIWQGCYSPLARNAAAHWFNHAREFMVIKWASQESTELLQVTWDCSVYFFNVFLDTFDIFFIRHSVSTFWKSWIAHKFSDSNYKHKENNTDFKLP